MLITNASGQTCRGKKGLELGIITPVSVASNPAPPPFLNVASSELLSEDECPHVAQVSSEERVKVRQQSLRKMFDKDMDHIPEREKAQLIDLLIKHHSA